MTQAQVDLIWLGSSEPGHWPLGQVLAVQPSPGPIRERLSAYLAGPVSPYCLFWDPSLGKPDTERVAATLEKPGDLWHAGLGLGMAGLPHIMDFVTPTWMLHCDPETTHDATSWRLSLRACLMRTSILRELGGPEPGFRTLEAAACEMGHRYVSRGVIPRHVPDLLGQIPPECSVHLPLEDEIRFSTLRFGSFWAEWALFRAVLARYTSFLEAWKAWWQTRSVKRAGECPPFVHDVGAVDESAVEPDSVSVLIPTLERYDYLRPLLTQLREQTVPPLEIIVVDQTPENRRYHQLQDDYPDLPLKCIYRDQRGQCSSRNAGLQLVRGAYVLFLDDDDEVQPNLIELHLRSVRRHRASVSSGVAHELGAGALPDEFKLFRVSDVLPTNNTLAHVSTFSRSGLFDLAYERGSRADGDLGMRIYRSGALMVLNPTIAVIHHHAPTGGLRTHNTRTITYASSRSRLFHRHLPSATEIYLAMRYFTARQVTEMLWQRALATLQLRGPLAARTLKIAMGLLLLPNTLWRMRRAYRDAMRLRDSFPVIPRFTPWHEARR